MPGRNYLAVSSVCAVLALVGLGVNGRAQLARGTLTGTVTDASGGVITNAAVIATNVATQVQTKTVTSGSGNYTFPDLIPAVYDISVSVAGFRDYVQRGITVNVGTTTSVDVRMAVGAATE